MNCKHCSNPLEEQHKFCPVCGKKVPPKPRPQPIQPGEMTEICTVPPILKPVEAAQLLKISRWKLDELRVQDKLPANSYIEIPGSGKRKIIRYRSKELLVWAGGLDVEITTAG